MKIVVGEGSCGIAAGAEKVRQALLKEDLNGAMLTIAGCIGTVSYTHLDVYKRQHLCS